VCRIEVYDWDMDGGHDFIGECTTNLEELAEGEGFQILQVTNFLMYLNNS
jgi:hypothetical protein